MRVKICGITNLKDALSAIRFGADALGFVFYKKSPRYIEPKSAKKIIEKLPPFVQKVGLFVHANSDEINSTCREFGLDLAQIHFDAEESLFDALEVPFIKVIRATSREDLLRYSDEYRLVDAFVSSYGGEGKRVETSWFDDLDCSKIILAGGLNAQNLDEVKRYNFYGFDVSSGVEKSKGIKDSSKIEAFIKKAKD